MAGNKRPREGKLPRRTGHAPTDLKNWIDHKGITQEAMGAKLGVTRQYVARVISGSVYPSRFLRGFIAKLTHNRVRREDWPEKCPKCGQQMPS